MVCAKVQILQVIAHRFLLGAAPSLSLFPSSPPAQIGDSENVQCVWSPTSLSPCLWALARLHLQIGRPPLNNDELMGTFLGICYRNALGLRSTFLFLVTSTNLPDIGVLSAASAKRDPNHPDYGHTSHEYVNCKFTKNVGDGNVLN